MGRTASIQILVLTAHALQVTNPFVTQGLIKLFLLLFPPIAPPISRLHLLIRHLLTLLSHNHIGLHLLPHYLRPRALVDISSTSSNSSYEQSSQASLLSSQPRLIAATYANSSPLPSPSTHIIVTVAVFTLMSVDLRASCTCLRYPARFVPVSSAQLSSVHTGSLTRPSDSRG